MSGVIQQPSITKSDNNNDSASVVAGEKFKSDKRQLGGLLLLLAFMPIIHPLVNIATRIGPNNTTPDDPSAVPLWSLIAGLCDVFFGTVGALTGYLALVHDYHNTNLTFFLMIITQLAYVPYVTDMTGVGMGAMADPANNPFIGPDFNPTQANVRFFGAIGVIAIFAWGFTFLGSLGFSEFALYTFQRGKPQERNESYFAGRLLLFSGMWTLAGLTQLILGIYTLIEFGNGPLEFGAVGVAMYVINYPEITIFVGLIHFLMGVWGVSRQWTNRGEEDHIFQMGVFGSWVLTIVLQVLVQISYSPAGAMAGAAPSILPLTVGLHLMPAFLDFKMRTVGNEQAHFLSESNSINNSKSMSSEEDEDDMA